MSTRDYVAEVNKIEEIQEIIRGIDANIKDLTTQQKSYVMVEDIQYTLTDIDKLHESRNYWHSQLSRAEIRSGKRKPYVKVRG